MSVPVKTTPQEFAAAMIEENPSLFDVIDDVRTIFDPAMIESSEELINHIIPVCK